MDGSDSSTSDSSSDESIPAQTVADLRVAHASTSKNVAPALEDDDSDSDVSMSADSDDDEGEAPSTSGIQMNQDKNTLVQPADTTSAGASGGKPNKRKYSGAAEDVPNGLPQELRKRLKTDEDMHINRTAEGGLPRDKALLPAEIWHHIFTFIPPRNLGLMLSVSKSFNAFLDPSSPGPSISPLSKSVLSPMVPDAIWRASRRLFLPGMPSPLNGKSELDMLRLACSSTCQFCGRKRQKIPSVTMDPWHPGPGENGIRPIWSFGVSTCGSCIQQRCTKEIDLLLSSSVPSQLMAALPFIFLTNEMHVLPLTTLQSGQPPPTIQITKNFFQPQIEDIKQEFLNVKSMGSATAEEWIKGLDDRGKERRNDSIRWERWEASGGVARMHIMEPQVFSNPATLTSNGTQPISTPSSTPGPTPNGSVPHFAAPNPQRFGSPLQNGLTPHPPRNYLQFRHERSKEEVAEVKAARRAEIERRCMLLDPPLTAGVLAHMTSFQAAMQIIKPLDDDAWQVLEPRLISQRQDAEQRENERLAQTRVVQERSEERNYPDVQPRPEPKDADREWEDIQAPLRLRIGGYADETIRDAWAGGTKVTKDNCPSFAAEVLMYVRKRFYAEVAKDEAAIRAAGHEPEMDPPGGPYTRKLTLENMKWVFDTKIKPHTEQYRKELFLCSECENHFKFYGFEGVIQHYAAKHTNELSVGSVVVHWKAEWPEYPPFNPEPLSSKASYYAAPPAATVPYPVTAPQQGYGYGGYQPSPLSASVPVANLHGYPENQGPYYGQPQYGDQYAGPQGDPYAPAYAEPPQGYPVPQYSGPPPVGNNLGYNEPPQDYAQPGYGGPYPATTQGYYGPQQPGPMYPVSGPEIVSQLQPPYAPQGSQYGYAYPQPPIQVPLTPVNQFPPAPVPERTEEYKAQLQDVAKSARDVWDAINNIKDIPGGVKVYTILYHVLKSSRANFPEDPPLTMIIDGLSNNKNMRKVRNINGLLCKACSLGMAGASSNTQKKHFSFPQLVNHFHSVHEQGRSQNEPAYMPDWTKDMVELPELTRLAPVFEKPGANEQKLKLISEALPEIFAILEQSLTDTQTGQTSPYGDRDQYSLAPSQDNHERYYVDSGRPSGSTSNTYDSSQYDPRNPRDLREDRVPEDVQPRYKVLRRAEEYYPAYEPRRISTPSHVRSADAYEREIIREVPSYVDRSSRYRDEGEVEYRLRRDPAALSYEDPPVQRLERQDILSATSQQDVPKESQYLSAEDTVAQQNRVFEVVAQITQQAREARERKPIKQEPQFGPEEGEVQARPLSKADEKARARPSAEASSAAERFLNEFQPGEVPGIAKTSDLERAADERLVRSDDRIDSQPRSYQHLPEARRTREAHEEDGRIIMARGRPLAEDESGYIIRERIPQAKQSPTYAYDDRYVHAAGEQTMARDRSPELVDRRYKLNNVVYREERQGGHGMRRTPSQFARYESIRLENDRARSRSPVYVKVGAQPGQYRERSPAHPFPEAVYGARAPLPENVAYERAPRQEYYRVYADDPRPRQPQYVETYEYVQVSDPKGDYMIRRPVRREREPEPIYATYDNEQYARKPVYEGEQYARKPVYESRAAVSRSDPAYYEEYDPRHPAPPPSAAPPRQRYQ